MKELRSRKTGITHMVSDEGYEKLKALKLAKRFTVKEITLIRQIVPTPRLDKPVIKEITKNKNHDKQDNQNEKVNHK